MVFVKKRSRSWSGLPIYSYMKVVCIKVFIIIVSALMTINCSLDARMYGLNGLESGLSKDTNGGSLTPPVLGSISFTLPSTFFKAQETVNLIPTKTAGCSEFAISPSLPNGLSIDFNTGAITGNSVDGAPKQVYTISAKDANGTIVTTTIEFEVARYFLVNTLSDTSDSSLGNGVCGG